MLVFTKLFPLYIRSLSLMHFLTILFFLLVPLTYFTVLPICSHFPMPPTSISPKSVHPETAFMDGKEKALDKAPI